MRAGIAFLLASLLLVAAQSLRAQESGGDVAFVFGYLPRTDQEARFDAGYRRHLDWHAEKGDSLVWYAWTVVAGDQIGEFVDGTFGTTLGAIDARVDPAGDRDDFAANAAPFADARFRSAWVLEPELGTDRSLEERRPSRLLEVVHVVLFPGADAAFETRLRAARARFAASGDPPAYAWYRTILGGREPGWTLLVPRQSWSDWASGPSGLDAWLPGDDGGPPLSDLVAEATDAVWAYRPDLSYIPE